MSSDQCSASIKSTHLAWIKDELIISLTHVAAMLRQALTMSDKQEPLTRCASDLHEINGALSIVEITSIGDLTDKLEYAVTLLVEERCNIDLNHLQILIKASEGLIEFLHQEKPDIEQLPLDLCIVHEDLEVIVQHLHAQLNEFMRFQYRKRWILPVYKQINFIRAAIMLRFIYQHQLLNCLQDDRQRRGFVNLFDIVCELERRSSVLEVKRYWARIAAFFAAVTHEEMVVDVSTKKIFGKVDREIKRLIQSGEKRFGQNLDEGLLQSVDEIILASASLDHRVLALQKEMGKAVQGDAAQDQRTSQFELDQSEIRASLVDDINLTLDTLYAMLQQLSITEKDEQHDETHEADILNSVADSLKELGLESIRQMVVNHQVMSVYNFFSEDENSQGGQLSNIIFALGEVKKALNGELASADSSKDASLEQYQVQAPEIDEELKDAIENDIGTIKSNLSDVLNIGQTVMA